MKQMESNPDITQFVLFSGGGGLVTRNGGLSLAAGGNQVKIREVPASLDPETLVFKLDSTQVKVREFVLKKPNQQYVNDNLRRESNCAQNLINTSIELGAHRPELLEVCESVMMRTYLDEEVELDLWLEATEAVDTQLTLSYFIDDVRFRWKPTIIVELDEHSEEAEVKGFIAITNESAHRFDDVDVSFADFAKDMNENLRLEPTELKKGMMKRRMKMMKFK